MYTVYMVFKLAPSEYYNLDFPFQEASINVGGSESTRQVCVQGFMEDGVGGVPQKHILRSAYYYPIRHANPLTDDVMFGRERSDGWMEVELGEFYNGEGYDGEVSISLMETKGGKWKSGLIVWSIEIRHKH